MTFKKSFSRRLLFVYLLIGFFMIFIMVWLSAVSADALFTSVRGANKTIVGAGDARGNIYDCKMRVLNNTGSRCVAVVKYPEKIPEALLALCLDSGVLEAEAKSGKPFACEINSTKYVGQDILVFNIADSDRQSDYAIHLLGYTSDGSGACGLEYAFDDILTASGLENSVTFNIDGMGRAICGDAPIVRKNENAVGGIVTTLDADIQNICEEASSDITGGAVVVMDIQSGDIKAMVSRPSYRPDTITEAISSDESPLINRALYPYSVGSIFKLVIASAAIDCGYENYCYECKGSINVNGRVFKCHRQSGHGMQSLEDAVVNSCNPYFISLTKNLDSDVLLETSSAFGFGSRISLARSIYSRSGNLPDETELAASAEKANFSFGQGVLTATPLQVCKMTCGIAGCGEMPEARLVLGATEDGINFDEANGERHFYSISAKTATKVQNLMRAVISEAESSPAAAENTSCAVKTSTAQTGKFDANGNELCHAWITGYFPAHEPKYAVTVFVENGGFGNKAAAPVFKEIAEKITVLE